MRDPKTWFITGASRGLGHALATAVLNRGDRAILTARNPDSLASLVDAHPDAVLAIALDVTEPAAITDAVAAAQDRFGSIDALVNNAGYGYRAAIEEGETASVDRLFATNVFGPINLIKAVLPGMRAKKLGAIVNVSSIGARWCPPGSGYYSATKAALEGLSGSLQKELEPLGISVTIVEPGSFRTDFSGDSIDISDVQIEDYAETAGKRRARFEGTQPGDPARAASVIIDAIDAEDTPDFLLLGPDALEVYDETSRQQAATVARWRDASASTDFA